MLWLDQHDDVLEWGSEEFFIPYRNPVDGRVHRYFPDFYVRRRGKDGRVETMIIEVKPAKETVEPKKQSKRTQKYINEVVTWGINTSKWKAAEEYCLDRGWTFKILTERELDIKG